MAIALSVALHPKKRPTLTEKKVKIPGLVHKKANMTSQKLSALQKMAENYRV